VSGILKLVGYLCCAEGLVDNAKVLNGASEFFVVALARISYQVSTAASDPGMSTVLHSVGLLDILSSMPAGPFEADIFTLGAERQAPCPSAPPRYETW
jgi:hypothetical protein